MRPKAAVEVVCFERLLMTLSRHSGSVFDTSEYGENITLNWDAVGAIAEGLGAAGVIASLLYLGVQVRASTRAASVDAKLASTRMYTDYLVLLVESPELNELMIRGRSNLESLDREGYLRFSNLALISFCFFSAGFFQYKKGTLSDDDWTELSVVIEYWVRGEGCRQWWEKMGRQSFGRPFVEFIESQIAQVNPE